jgi:hypothetical protein
MRLLNLVYYCIYRYVLKTPGRLAADAWSGVILAWSLWIHALMAFWIFTLATRVHLPVTANAGKIIWLGALFLLAAMFYWHYVWKGNNERVIQRLEKRGSPEKYARIGSIMWYESLLLVFVCVGLLILSQKLTGWPPHP